MRSTPPINNDLNLNLQCEMVEHIMGIVDTRLQLIDFKTKQMISSFVDLELVDHKQSRFGLGISNTEAIVANNEQVLQQIEIYSKTVKILLNIRAKVTNQNAFIILYLLEDNKFLNFEDEVVFRMLELNFNDIKNKGFDEIYAMAS